MEKIKMDVECWLDGIAPEVSYTKEFRSALIDFILEQRLKAIQEYQHPGKGTSRRALRTTE